MSANNQNISDKIKGAVYGALIGNSLGGCTTGMNHKDILVTLGADGIKHVNSALSKSQYLNHEFGNILSDSHLALANVKTVLDNSNEFLNGKFNKSLMVENLYKLLEDPTFLNSNPSTSCLVALRKMNEQSDYCLIGSDALTSSGATQALFLGLLPKNKFNLIDITKNLIDLSYDDDQMVCAACVVVDSLNYILSNDLDSKQSVRDYVNRELALATSYSSKFADAWDNIAPDLDYSEQALTLPYSLINMLSEVNELIPSAIGLFLIFRQDLPSVIINTALAGGQTATAGFLTGALAGAYLGFKAIPTYWHERFTKLEEVDTVVNNIIKLWDDNLK